MRIGSLFSGIGGLELGLEWAGFGPTVWQVEQSEFCRKVLERHWPNVRRYDDVRTVGKHNLEPVDIIAGGFPCQDISAAGKGAGLSGSRSGLWYEFARIVAELRPGIVVVENVASGATRYVDEVRDNLEREGYKTLPVPLSAAACGAWHRRCRIFIVGIRTDGRAFEYTRRATADTRGERTRKQQGGYGRPGRAPGTAINTSDGAAEFMADADNPRPQGHRAKHQLRSVEEAPSSGRCDWWATEPPLDRMAYGVSDRVDRLRSLGNAVVPQCGQVVGELIKLLLCADNGGNAGSNEEG